eukprot:CAMPEP_0181397020 /NCGR_PEP_ID=MMETSP1110-20121109/241_1 /TAXON_ID=174948 /ORGANISM="Symbiodinium sp., Strain CCMP421" /LENGTH=81 /DNA_ID=CAMNT_0023518789 /DNA_START=43 /DNA_END=288 /DNA_ORIENTATION=+
MTRSASEPSLGFATVSAWGTLLGLNSTGSAREPLSLRALACSDRVAWSEASMSLSDASSGASLAYSDCEPSRSDSETLSSS